VAAKRKAPGTAPLALDIRDQRLPGGRLAVAAGTADPEARARYRDAILAVLDTDLAQEVVRRLKLPRGRKGKLTPRQIHDAVRAYDLASLVAGEAEQAVAPREVRPAMLAATIDRFLRQVRSDLAPGTAEKYSLTARQMEVAFGVDRSPHGEIVRDVVVRDVSREQALEFLKEKKASTGRPWSPQTQSVAWAVAHQVWAMALVEEEDQAERGGLTWRPWRNFWSADRQRPKATVRAAKKKKTRHNILTREQAARLLRVTKGSRLSAWVAIGFYGGLRMGEVIHLRTDRDVDLQAGELRVQGRKGDHPWTPKGNRPREVPMNTPLSRWVARHIQDGYAGERYLFRNLQGADRPMSLETGARWTAEAFSAAGIRYGGRRGDALSYHSLRHTFGSWLAMQGISPKAIAELMGNTVEVVLSTYLHLYPGERKRAVERMRRKLIP